MSRGASLAACAPAANIAVSTKPDIVSSVDGSCSLREAVTAADPGATGGADQGPARKTFEVG